MSITQTLTLFDSTKQPIEGTIEFRANATYAWSWLIEHTNQQIALINQINSTVSDMNSLAQTVTSKAQEVSTNTGIVNQAKTDTLAARDTTLNAKSAVESMTGLGLTGLANGDTLEYDSSVSKFKNTNLHSKTAKTTPVDADEIMIADSTTTFSLKKITWGSIKTTIKTFLDTYFIPKVTTPTTNALAKIQADGTIKNSSVIEDANGNVGFGGITPKGWVLSGYNALEIGNASLFAGNNSEVQIISNAYYNGAWKYETTNAASRYSQYAGSHYWLSALSGIAGNTATFTQTMTLDLSGNLLLGATSQINGARLSIATNASATAHASFGGDHLFRYCDGGSANVSNAGYSVQRIIATNRSINAAGTINASGADYAEYEYSNDITLIKGQIVGFKVDGTLTDNYSESIRFAIKSTNPSIVGGDAWGTEEIVGKRPEQPVRKLDITEQKLIKDAVLGDDETILEDAVYETVIIEKGDSDKEWKLIYSTYEKDLADFEARLEAERQKVDRIAYAGKVPVNVYDAKAGQYIIASNKDDSIIGIAVDSPTFEQYLKCVGRVNKILDDGRAEVAVIIH